MGQLSEERDGSVGGFRKREVALTVGDYGALDDGTKQVPTLWKMQAFKTTAEGVNQTQTCGLPCKVRLDLVVASVHIARDVLDDLSEEGWGRELGCALHIILHEDGMCNVECGQNLLACVMLIRGDEGTGLLRSAV